MKDLMAQVTLAEVGTFFVGLAALLTILWAITCKLVNHLSKIRTKEIIEATSRSNQLFIRETMLKGASEMDPSQYYTLEICFEPDFRLSVPMFPNKAIRVSENINMTVIAHSGAETIMTLICDGFGSLKRHWHPDTNEEIQVIKGVCTDVETGRMYRAGESWILSQGEKHSATFQDFVGFVTHRPPLKTAKDRPVDLADIDKIFPHKP